MLLLDGAYKLLFRWKESDLLAQIKQAFPYEIWLLLYVAHRNVTQGL